MRIADQWKDYEIIDTSKGEKLERWGSYTLVRPDPQAIWNTPRRHPGWKRYDARYARSHTGGGQWVKKDLPQRWQVRYGALTFNIKPMNFKHTGLFPEQAANWDFAMEQIQRAVQMEPGNSVYQQAMQTMRQSGSTYNETGQEFQKYAEGMGRFCTTFMMLQFCCLCCRC